MIIDLMVAHTKGSGITKGTKTNLHTQLQAYRRFCDRYSLKYFPADNKQICRFGQYLSLTFESPDAVTNYLSGVRTCHHVLGMQPPDAKEKQMQWFIQGLKRLMDHLVKQAEPITPELLVRISKVVNYTNQVDMVAWVAVLIGFTMFMRKSNLVPDNMDSFDGEHQFRRSDFNILDPNRPMMVEVRWSKTNQFKNRILRVPVLPTRNKAICPVLWTHYMLSKVHAEPQDAAFTIYQDNEKKALSANQLVARIRKWIKLLKMDESAYSLHSMRRGGATFAHQCNIQADMIKLLGDWASSAYQRYIDINIDDRYDTMEAFVEGLNKRTI